MRFVRLGLDACRQDEKRQEEVRAVKHGENHRDKVRYEDLRV
jgi:hypothetical protein